MRGTVKETFVNFKDADYIIFGFRGGLGEPRGESLVRFPPVIYHPPYGDSAGIKKVLDAWKKIEEKHPKIKSYEIWGTYLRSNFHEILQWLADISNSQRKWLKTQPDSIAFFNFGELKFVFYYIDVEIDSNIDDTFTTEETFSESEDEEYIDEEED